MIQVILGNIAFHHLSVEELSLFKTDKEQKALVHEVAEVHFFKTIEEAYEVVDNTHFDSWLIPCEYDGEIVFERTEDEVKCNTME